MNDEVSEKIEAMSPISNSNKPGGTILIAQGNTIIFSKGFGKTNLKLDIDMKTQNEYLFSTSNIFNAI